MLSLFVYGTLQAPEVMQKVTGHAFAARPARLEGYSRHRLRGKSYPGIRPASGASVAGACYEVDDASLSRLDAFEDDFYRRETVKIVIGEGEERWAQTYVMLASHYGMLLPEDWDFEAFRRESIAGFLARHE